MLNQFAKGLLVATSMASILGAVAVKDSEILDQYTVTQIIQHSNGYDLDIRIDLTTGQERIVFPAEKAPAKKLLQFLNEELFIGAITERLFETNLKRIAD